MEKGKEINEWEILNRWYKYGNEADINYFIDKYQKLIYANIFRIVSNKETTEDLIQEFWSKVAKLDPTKIHSSVSGLFIRTSLNLALDYNRKQQLSTTPITSSVEQTDYITPETILEKKDMTIEVKGRTINLSSLFHILSDFQQEIARKFFGKGIEDAEKIAKELDTDKQRVIRERSRMLIKLANQVNKLLS